MARIAEQADVSKGTLYNYFVNKSQLFSAFVERETDEKRAFILSTAEGSTDGIEVRPELAAALCGIARRLIQSQLTPAMQSLHRLVLSKANKFPHLAEIYYNAGHKRAIREMSDWLQARIGSKQLSITDVGLAAEQLVALCQTRLWTQHCFNLRSDASENEIEIIVNASVTMFLKTYSV